MTERLKSPLFIEALKAPDREQERVWFSVPASSHVVSVHLISEKSFSLLPNWASTLICLIKFIRLGALVAVTANHSERPAGHADLKPTGEPGRRV